MAFIIWHGLNGKPKDIIFDMLEECPVQHEGIRELTRKDARWRTKTKDELITLPGRCLWTLESALWCVYHTSTFKDALITAINLGGDADTVGSVTGQIAGAIYGLGGIPKDWLEDLHHCLGIVEKAIYLYYSM
jgi:ADP-ribosylglycohydrolase